jgi:hypothetical protein
MNQLERVGLSDVAFQAAGNVSLGQQRIVEIARALCADPTLLLLDEPAAGLRYKEKIALAELLDIVGGDAAPSWLRDLLSDLSFEVRSSHSIETLLPTKKGLSDDLEAIEKYALKLARLLQSTMTPGFIATAAGKESESYINDGLGFLSVLVTDVRKTKNSPRLVTSDGEVLRGAGRPHLPGSMPPKYVCMAIIAEVYSFFHQNEDPTPSNRQALEAAARFYGAWFEFDARKWGNDALKGWEYYLKFLSHPELKALRSEVRRLLANCAHFEAMMTENNGQ